MEACKAFSVFLSRMGVLHYTLQLRGLKMNIAKNRVQNIKERIAVLEYLLTEIHEKINKQNETIPTIDLNHYLQRLYCHMDSIKTDIGFAG